MKRAEEGFAAVMAQESARMRCEQNSPLNRRVVVLPQYFVGNWVLFDIRSQKMADWGCDVQVLLCPPQLAGFQAIFPRPTIHGLRSRAQASQFINLVKILVLQVRPFQYTTRLPLLKKWHPTDFIITAKLKLSQPSLVQVNRVPR